MRQLTNIFCSIIIICMTASVVNASFNGGVIYSIPADYSVINEQELLNKANPLYERVLAANSAEITPEMTEVLNLYTILSNVNPQNQEYVLKLGKLYDVIGKDRYAKSNFYRSIGIDPQKPEGYFCLGEFYYKREYYRKALKFYKKASDRGFNNDEQTISRLNDIYKKLGDKK